MNIHLVLVGSVCVCVLSEQAGGLDRGGVNLCLVRASSAPPLCLLFFFVSLNISSFFVGRPLCFLTLFSLLILSSLSPWALYSLSVHFPYVHLSLFLFCHMSSFVSLSFLWTFHHLESTAPLGLSGCEAQLSSLCSKKHVAESPGRKGKASTGEIINLVQDDWVQDEKMLKVKYYMI